MARAFVPFQPFCDVLPLEVALEKGTIWTCLLDHPPREKGREKEDDQHE
ncbi:MAG TPA: spore coat associated protein CotJA [Syntrophomonadaceae bacterium]|nr:spore coat associated protein CotJA [Syntrophomonadaceae bacterium]HQE23798.1 spore coat associated protein CotJA [Syntrophomonadaceae bacterium]